MLIRGPTTIAPAIVSNNIWFGRRASGLTRTQLFTGGVLVMQNSNGD